jgi:hypothetical protein
MKAIISREIVAELKHYIFRVAIDGVPTGFTYESAEDASKAAAYVLQRYPTNEIVQDWPFGRVYRATVNGNLRRVKVDLKGEKYAKSSGT